MRTFPVLTLALTVILVLQACSGTKKMIESQNFRQSNISPALITDSLPNYNGKLKTVKGKGRALISTPNQSDRATIYFASNADTSKIAIKNRIGIQGGELLASRDSILVYNKVDDYARKISVHGAYQTRLNSLASVNIIDILNFSVDADQVKQVHVGNTLNLLILNDKTRIYIDKNKDVIQRVELPQARNVPYHRIEYDGYKQIEGYLLPRKLTIFSADRRSKVTLLIQSLQINPTTINLSIDLPDEISIERL